MNDMSIYVSDFIDYCKFRKSLNTKTTKAYSIDLHQFFEHTHNFDKTALCEYISYIHKQCKPKTCRRKIATLKAFTHYLFIEDIIDRNPFDKIDVSFREPLVLPKTIPINAINEILKTAYEQIDNAKTDYAKRTALRNVAVIEVLFATGARVSEVCSLTSERVDMVNYTIKIFGKGSKERIIQIENCDVQKVLLKYEETFRAEIKSSGYFFVNKFKTD